MKLLFPSFLLNVILAGIVVWGVMTGGLLHQGAAQNPAENATSSVQTVGIDKTWNLISQSNTITLLTAQKTVRIVSGDKRYTATKNKSFFILNSLLSNTGASSETIPGKDLPTVKIGDTTLNPYFTSTQFVLDPGSSITRSLVYVVDTQQKVFTVVVEPLSGPQQILTVTFK